MLHGHDVGNYILILRVFNLNIILMILRMVHRVPNAYQQGNSLSVFIHDVMLSTLAILVNCSKYVC